MTHCWLKLRRHAWTPWQVKRELEMTKSLRRVCLRCGWIRIKVVLRPEFLSELRKKGKHLADTPEKKPTTSQPAAPPEQKPDKGGQPVSPYDANPGGQPGGGH